MISSLQGRIETASEAGTQACGQALAPLIAPGDVVLLSGDLGAGKTQLTKGIALGLGVPEPVTSPTFNMMLVHYGRLPLYHFDLYRLDDARQLDDLDYFATLEADGVSVVEWGDRFNEAAPADGLAIVITIFGDQARRIEVASLGERGHRIAQSWLAACGRLEGVRAVRERS